MRSHPMRTCGPIRCCPTRCSPVRCCLIRCDPIRCCPIRCGPIRCCPIRCCPIRCGPVRCCPIPCGPIRCGPCGPIRCCPIRCGPIRCCPIRCGPIRAVPRSKKKVTAQQHRRRLHNQSMACFRRASSMRRTRIVLIYSQFETGSHLRFDRRSNMKSTLRPAAQARGLVELLEQLEPRRAR